MAQIENIGNKIEKPLDLILREKRYKMYIPLKVEEKIRLLLNEIHNIEWSGILFYTVQGSFEEGSLEIHCEDILLMDIGSSAFTEYDMNTDIVNYMIEHPELMQPTVYQGLCHSHHSMNCFFSGTDTNTLRKEGNDVNHFVSLIVNNAGTYNAAVTRKITSKQNIEEIYTYNTWNGNTLTSTRTFDNTKSYIEYYYLDIEVQKVKTDDIELHDRIKEIKNKKNQPKEFPPFFSRLPREVSRPSNDKMELPEFTQVSDAIPESRMGKYIQSIAKHLVKQIITCNILVPKDATIDLEKWSNNMENLYTKRFGNIKEFNIFASNYLDYILYNATPEDCPILDHEFVSELSQAIITELNNLNIDNKWVDEWISLLTEYVF